MSKELEALHTIAFNTQISGMNFGDELRTLEKAIQELEDYRKVMVTPIPKLIDELREAEEDKKFIDLILNKPQLLCCFAFDGTTTWELFEDTFSDEDKEYINTTKEEFEFMRAMLIKKGKIDNE